MPWVPEDTLLGTHPELGEFTHEIEYYEPGTEADPLADPPVEGGEDVYYNVRITPQEGNPETIIFTEGIVETSVASIGGYFKQAFNDSLTTKSNDGVISTITTLEEPVGGVFSKVNRDSLTQVISFKADTTRSRLFTYTATAYEIIDDEEVVVATNEYTILLQDKNWTPGMMNLKELVSYASSK
jgi:hypothetical protein